MTSGGGDCAWSGDRGARRGGGRHTTAGPEPSWPRCAGCGEVTRGGYSGPESSDVGRSAYGSARGRGAHGGGGEGRCVRAPACGRTRRGSERLQPSLASAARGRACESPAVSAGDLSKAGQVGKRVVEQKDSVSLLGDGGEKFAIIPAWRSLLHCCAGSPRCSPMAACGCNKTSMFSLLAQPPKPKCCFAWKALKMLIWLCSNAYHIQKGNSEALPDPND